MDLRASPHDALTGRSRVPGDKSISHRSIMLAALAAGTSRITGLLEGEDVMATAAAFRALGATVERGEDSAWTLTSRGLDGLTEPADVLDMGNAGTGARLLMGILAGQPFTSVLTGDGSLRGRPMRRVIEPLSAMGVEVLARGGDRLPLALRGRRDPRAIVWRSTVASAQVKSAVLLAGLRAAGTTTVVEPVASRDHTERMLTGMGATVTAARDAHGAHVVTLEGGPSLRAQDVVVPGDPSSAAFPIVAALLAAGSAVVVENVGLNPLRTGLLVTLREMGAALEIAGERTVAGEPVGDIVVRGGPLAGVEVPAQRAPTMIDEYPVLAVAAACARGRTVMRGLGELRVKESDRLEAVAAGLAACGVAVAIDGDDLTVEGGRPAGGAAIDARLDHRIAMSFLVLGGAARAAVTVRGAETIDTSFPGFAALMNGLGARIAPAG
jgi:3-phosphoshikimate 1-carboxyvinyltransferase